MEMSSQRGTSDVKRYPGSLHDPRFDILGLLFLVTYLLVILLVEDWEIRSLLIALWVFHGLALLLARIWEPYVECDSSGVRIRFLFAPPISIPYRDIANAAEVTQRLDPISRVLEALARAKTPGFEPWNFPAVRLSLTKRRWVLLFTPIPVFVPVRQMRVPVTDASGLVQDITSHLRAARS